MKNMIRDGDSCLGGICRCKDGDTEALVERDPIQSSIRYAFPGCSGCGELRSSQEYHDVVEERTRLKFAIEEYKRKVIDHDTMLQLINYFDKIKDKLLENLNKEQKSLQQRTSDFNADVKKLYDSKRQKV